MNYLSMAFYEHALRATYPKA